MRELTRVCSPEMVQVEEAFEIVEVSGGRRRWRDGRQASVLDLSSIPTLTAVKIKISNLDKLWARRAELIRRFSW